MGKKVALSGNFNILKAKKVLQEYNFYSKVEPFKMIFFRYAYTFRQECLEIKNKRCIFAA